jgi:hypothetical protein
MGKKGFELNQVMNEWFAVVGERQRNAPLASNKAIDFHQGEARRNLIPVEGREVNRFVSIGLREYTGPSRGVEKRVTGV